MTKEPEAYIEDFLEFLISVRGYSEHTIESYATALSQMSQASQWYKENNRWVLDIMPLRLKLSSKNKKTIVLRLSAIRSFVKYLEEHHSLRIKLTGDASIKIPQTLPKPIEEQYIQEVLAEANPKERLLISLLYGLGLRISELSTLRLNQISSEWIEVVGKGRKSRQIPLLPSLQKLITLYVDHYTPKKYLFEKGGAPLNTAQLRYRIHKIFASCGIKATPHQLRHSFATHLLHHGARISDVSELLGHSSMATTQVYTKLASSKKMQEYMKAHPLVNEEPRGEE
jgi:integrase/recombinase XerC